MRTAYDVENRKLSKARLSGKFHRASSPTTSASSRVESVFDPCSIRVPSVFDPWLLFRGLE